MGEAPGPVTNEEKAESPYAVEKSKVVPSCSVREPLRRRKRLVKSIDNVSATFKVTDASLEVIVMRSGKVVCYTTSSEEEEEENETSSPISPKRKR